MEATVVDVTDPDVTDEELAALALAGDVDAPLPDGAEPLDLFGRGPSTLPGWYMPASTAGVASTSFRRRFVVWSIVGAFAAIDAVGLCSTYGSVQFG